MKKIIKHFEKLRKIKRKKYHSLLHKIRKQYGVSRRTLLYVKEYGPHSNVPRTILKESFKILILASIISSFGGLALEQIKTIFISIIPLVILLPTLNNIIGDFGIIASSRFTTLLYQKKIRGRLLKNKHLRELFFQLMILSIFTVIITSSLALIVSIISGYSVDKIIIYKIFLISIIDVIFLILLLFVITIFAGLYIYKKKEDPDNFLIPITTSIADFGNMILLAFLVITFF